ncbi:MAG: TetR/AcrR family transcriptional regulator [Actinobacteria bacterium]|nr:TetR/AcrR family transcriptional regulator [Actinomycetota bacterium]
MADGDATTHDQRKRPRRGEGRESLLAAVARIVARQGIDGVTFRSVAAEAGVSPGLATYHFPNREAMLQEAMTWAVRDAIESIARPGTSSAGFLRESVDFVAAKPGEMTFQFETIFHGLRDPGLGMHIREMYERYYDAVQDWLRREGLPAGRTTAKLALAVMDGLAVQELIFDDVDDTRRIAEVFQGLLGRLEGSGVAEAAEQRHSGDQAR